MFLVDEDIDGVPMDDEDSLNIRNKEDEKKPSIPAGFVPSRWETVDPDQVEKITLILFYILFCFIK